MSVLAARLSRHERTYGLLGSAVAAVGWGFGGIFATLAPSPGLVVTSYRLWIGAGLLTTVVYGSGRRLSLRSLRAAFLGGLCLVCDMSMFFSAIKLTSIVDATVIGALQPVLVIIAARPLFGERMGRVDALWIVLAVGGVTTAVLGPGIASHHAAVGNLLALGALLAFSAYWLVSKHARAAENALEYTASVTIVAAVLVIPVVLISGQSLTSVPARSWLWICLLAAVPGTAHVIMNWAHRYVDASVSSVIGSSNPIVAAAAAVVILGQPLTVLQICGGLVGVVAIAAVAARHRQSVESPVE